MTHGHRLLSDYLTQHFELDPQLLAPHVPLTDLDMDSLALIELAMRVEEDHGVTLDGLDPFSTLAEAADALDQCLAAAANTAAGAVDTAADPAPASAV